MKILITTAIWGREYCDTFLQFSLSSLNSRGNVPKLSKANQITLQIIAPPKDLKYLQASYVVRHATQFCEFEWIDIEQIGYDALALPTGPEGEKYSLMSECQNFAIQSAMSHDYLVFNYADFVWCEYSLSNVILSLQKGKDAVLGFCIPVEEKSGKNAISRVLSSTSNNDEPFPGLKPRDGARIAFKNMHREARLRFWDGPAFSITPSYLMWLVENEGLILRAYHQTILGMKVDAKDDEFKKGIQFGSLDANFVKYIVTKGNFEIAKNSDDILVFSLYETIVTSEVGGPADRGYFKFPWKGAVNEAIREEIVLDLLAHSVAPVQRELACTAIELRFTREDNAEWERTSKLSGEIISRLNSKARFDQDEYDRIHTPTKNVETNKKAIRARPAKTIAYQWILRRLILPQKAFLVEQIGLERLKKIRCKLEKYALQAPLTNTSQKQALNPVIDEENNWNWIAVENDEKEQELEAIKSSVSNTEALAAKAVSFKEIQSSLANTEAIISKALGDGLATPELLRYLGRTLWFSGRFKEALYSFQQAENQKAETIERFNLNDVGVMLPQNTAAVIGLIGHIDAFVKRKILNNDHYSLVLLLPPEQKLANKVALEYWSEHVEVVSDPARVRALQKYAFIHEENWNWVITDQNNRVQHVHAAIAQIQGEWSKRKLRPLLSLKFPQRKILNRVLLQWGMTWDDWFVCLHVRTESFYEEIGSGGAQTFRNTPIEDYYEAIETVLDLGGWVVRMGDSSMPPIDKDHFAERAYKVIDYALCEEKCEDLDIALCASCSLFVSSPSGLYTLAKSFGKTACLVNFPMWQGLPWHAEDVFTPITYIWSDTGEVLSIREIYENNLHLRDQNFLIEQIGVEIRKNSSREISETVRQALEGVHYELPVGKTFGPANRVNMLFRKLNHKFNTNSSGQLGAYYASRNAKSFLKPAKQTRIEVIKSEKNDFLGLWRVSNRKTKSNINTERYKELESHAENPVLDVLIPTFNRPRLLFRCLSSFMATDVEGMRIVVIDDASNRAERIPYVGVLDTKQVCDHFATKRILYVRNETNMGVPLSWAHYYENICDAEFTMSLTDKDVFIDGGVINEAITKMRGNPDCGLVVMPFLQTDRSQEHTEIKPNYSGIMPGTQFLDHYVSDHALQHVSMWGLARVSAVKDAGLPRSMNLRDFGLDDGFGIDLDFIFSLAKNNSVGFQEKPHIRRYTLAGGTEKYPLTFAYTYYQYAKRITKELVVAGKLSKANRRKYLGWWLVLIIRGYNVTLNPVHGTEAEFGTERISNHMRINIWLYIVIQMVKYQIEPPREVLRYFCSINFGEAFINEWQRIINEWQRIIALPDMVESRVQQYLKRYIKYLREYIKYLREYIKYLRENVTW